MSGGGTLWSQTPADAPSECEQTSSSEKVGRVSVLGKDFDHVAGRQEGQHAIKILFCNSDTTGGGLETGTRNMQEDGAAQARAWRGVVVTNFNHDVVKAIVAP